MAETARPGRGRKLAPLELQPAVAQTLERWSKSGLPVAERARIVLACTAGHSNVAIAERLATTAHRVGRWRAAFLAHGLEGLLGDPAAGARPKISAGVISTASAHRDHRTVPSSRGLAKELGISQSSAVRALQLERLLPERDDPGQRSLVGLLLHAGVRAFCLAKTPARVARREPLAPALLRACERCLQRGASAREGSGALALLRFAKRLARRAPSEPRALVVVGAAASSTSVQRWLAARPEFRLQVLATRAGFWELLAAWSAHAYADGLPTTVGSWSGAPELFVRDRWWLAEEPSTAPRAVDGGSRERLARRDAKRAAREQDCVGSPCRRARAARLPLLRESS